MVTAKITDRYHSQN